jgi:hypothetical protein
MAKAKPVVLDLKTLGAGIPALTAAIGAMHAESAAVCLENQGHAESVELLVSENKEQFELRRKPVSARMRRAYFDLQNATELGACGIALLLARELTGLTAIQQSRKGGGFDYWLGPANQPADTLAFQNSARLEVSGILSGTETQMSTRLKQKVDQMEPSDDTGLPGIAVVIEFSRPQAKLEQRSI